MSASQQTASKAANVQKQPSSGLIAPDALPSSTQKAFDQQTGYGGKSSGPSASLATASSAAAAALGAASGQAAMPEVNQPAAEEPMGVDHQKQTASISERAVAEDQGMLQTAPAGQGRTEQPGLDARAAGASSPLAGVPTEGAKLDSSSGRAKKSSRELDKKSSRDSKREADKPSRAKRRRSKSRSQSDSPKR